MDRLSIFFSHFTLSARIFLAGTLCGTSSDHAIETAGHLHLLRRGRLTIFEAGEPSNEVEGPCVLLYIRPGEHIFRSEGADIVCAFVEFGAGMLNPLASALPKRLIIPLTADSNLVPTAECLFTEAFSRKDGRQVAVDRLAEYFLCCCFASQSIHKRCTAAYSLHLPITTCRECSRRSRSSLRGLGHWRNQHT